MRGTAAPAAQAPHREDPVDVDDVGFVDRLPQQWIVLGLDDLLRIDSGEVDAPFPPVDRFGGLPDDVGQRGGGEFHPPCLELIKHRNRSIS